MHTTLMMANALVVAAQAVLLLVLVVLYVRMLREMPTRFTLGLLVFALVLFLQCLLQLYLYVRMEASFREDAEPLILVTSALAMVATGFLTSVTAFPVGGSTRDARTRTEGLK